MGEGSDNALSSDMTIERIIGKIEGEATAPVIIFLGGIHGNEPSGVYALQRVFERLQAEKKNVKGAVYAIAGNLPALRKGVRYIENDLNRIWTENTIEKLMAMTPGPLSVEEQEAKAIYTIILELLERHTGPFYFIDFHTTSSKTLPFITISDSLINRKFSMRFPVPIVLGIEEYLKGALLSYANQLGYVALAFESGQHQEDEAIKNTIAFIYLSLVFCGCLAEEDIPEFKDYTAILKTASHGKETIYEVTGSYIVDRDENFKMVPGFDSFEHIAKGTLLAKSNGNPVKAKKKTVLFMPLYQAQGSEGFFTIRQIPKFFLKLSAWLRNAGMDTLLTLLPGVSWETPNKETLLVNIRVARFLTKPLFHLLGYRSWQIDETHIRMINRERRAKTGVYRKAPWYRRK